MKNALTFLLLIGLFFSCGSSIENSKQSEVPTETQPKQDSLSTEKTEKTDITASSPLYGIDISVFQKDEIDFINKKEDSLSFVFCRATQGDYLVDPKFEQNWTTIAEKGFIRGAYHFYMCDNDAIRQAKLFLKTVGDLPDTALPLVADFEEESIDKNQSKEEIQQNFLTFLNYLEDRTGRKPMIYTNPDTGDRYLTKSIFADYALWVADYSKAEAPFLPTVWREKGVEWQFWQRTSHYYVNGQRTDFDLYNGNLTDLETFIQTYGR